MPGFWEIVIIAVVALVVLGPEQLPQVARQAGRFMRTMRRMSNELMRAMEEAAGPLDTPMKEWKDLRDLAKRRIMDDAPVSPARPMPPPHPYSPNPREVPPREPSPPPPVPELQGPGAVVPAPLEPSETTAVSAVQATPGEPDDRTGGAP